MNEYVVVNGELYHYGIKGMKWGKRKAQDPTKAEYKSAKKALRKAAKTYRKEVGFTGGIGIKGIAKEKKAFEKYREAELDAVMAKAKYKATKSEKAEKRAFTREMAKSGIRGSGYDVTSRGRSTDLYDRIKREKGKAYADQIEKRVERQATSMLIGAAVVTLGSAVVSGYLAANS